MIGAVSSGVSGLSDLFGDDEEQPSAETELATALEVVRNRRRRLVLRLVADLDVGESMRVRDLAHEIAAIEQDDDPAAMPWSESKSVYVALTQNHLDKIAAADALEIDDSKRDDHVLPGPALDAFEALLDDAADYFERGEP